MPLDSKGLTLMVPTAQVIELAPYRSSAEVVAAESAVLSVADEARELNVIDKASEAAANELFGRIRTARKTVAALKVRWLKPFKDQVELVAADFKEIERPAAEAEPIVSGKLEDYRAKVAEAARKEQERLRLLAERKQERQAVKAEARGVEPPPVIPITPTVAPPAKSVTAEDGSRVTYVTGFHAEIINAAAVPREWCCPDVKKLGAAARAEIITPDDCPAGVRVVTTEKPRFYKGR